MNAVLPKKYSSYSYGAMPNPKGDLVRVYDLVQYLEHVLDDDSRVSARVLCLLEHCRSVTAPHKEGGK